MSVNIQVNQIKSTDEQICLYLESIVFQIRNGSYTGEGWDCVDDEELKVPDDTDEDDNSADE